jgi:hypothetical protein
MWYEIMFAILAGILSGAVVGVSIVLMVHWLYAQRPGESDWEYFARRERERAQLRKRIK